MEHEENDPGLPKTGMLNLAGFLPRSAVNGPGCRAVVWVQGCPIRCEGCFNPQFWSFARAGYVPVATIAEQILSVSEIVGVTFSGGEPFAQAGALARLGEKIHEGGLSIVTYTGYTYEEIISKQRSSWLRLLSVTDLLVAGPYIPALSCTTPFIGSSNQSVIRLSDRIASGAIHPQDEGATVEFIIAPDGTLTATGFPDQRLVQAFAACQNGR